MKMINKFFALALLSSTTLFAGTAMAATADGALGATSTGTVDVTLTIPESLQVTGFTAMTLGTYARTGTMAGNTDLCVYHNGTAAYHATATADTGSFVVKNLGNGIYAANAKSIAMTVSWNNASGTAGKGAMTYNTQYLGANADTASLTCGGGHNANLSVDFAEADLQAAPADDYAAQITVLIEP